MRISPFAATLAAALAASSGMAIAGSVTVLQTPNAQATKFSQNGQYLVAYIDGQGGLRWDAASGTEEVLSSLVYANGINNAGTVAGAWSNDGGVDNGGHNLPALLAVGTSTPTQLPLPTGTDNANVYDVADDGTAVGLAYSSDFTVAKAYYHSPVDGLVTLPVDSPTTASRANAISADGRVVGGWNDDVNSGARRGVVWVDRVPTYIQDDQGNSLDEATGVSGNGQWVVGSGWRFNVTTQQLTLIPSMPFAFGVSDDGNMIVGASGFFDTPPRALLIWTATAGVQELGEYLGDRGMALPPELPLPLQGGLTAISGDGSKIAGWTIGSDSLVSIVIDGANGPVDHIFSDSFELPPPPPVVQDGGFEETSTSYGPNPYWTASDSNDPTSTFFVAGGFPTHGGVYTTWFGGWGGANQETQSIEQTVTIPAGSPRYLNYWRFAAELPDLSANFTVSIDGTPVETTDLTTIFPDEGYTLRSIDISAWADGADHVLRFQYDYPGGGSTDGSVYIDDVSIDPTDTPTTVGAVGRHVDAATAAAMRRHKH